MLISSQINALKSHDEKINFNSMEIRFGMTEVHAAIIEDLINRGNALEKYVSDLLDQRSECDSISNKTEDEDIKDFYFSLIDQIDQKKGVAYDQMNKILKLLPSKVYLVSNFQLSVNQFPIEDNGNVNIRFKAFDNDKEITTGDMILKSSSYEFHCEYKDDVWRWDFNATATEALILLIKHHEFNEEYQVKLSSNGGFFTFEPASFTIYYEDIGIPNDFSFKAFNEDEDEETHSNFIMSFAGLDITFSYNEETERYEIVQTTGDYEQIVGDDIAVMRNDRVQASGQKDGRDIWDRGDLTDFCKDHKDDEAVTIENKYFKGSIEDFKSYNINVIIFKNCIFSNVEYAFRRKKSEIMKLTFIDCKVEGKSCEGMFAGVIKEARSSLTNHIIHGINNIAKNVKRCMVGIEVTGLDSADVKAQNVLQIQSDETFSGIASVANSSTKILDQVIQMNLKDINASLGKILDQKALANVNLDNLLKNVVIHQQNIEAQTLALAEMTSVIAADQTNCNNMLAAITQTQERIRNLENSEAVLATLQANRDALQKEYEEVFKAYREAKKVIEVNDETIRSIETKRAQLQSEIDDLNQQIEKANQTLAKKSCVKNFNKVKAAKAENINKINEINNKAKKEHRSLTSKEQKEIDKYQARVDKQNAELTKLQKQIDDEAKKLNIDGMQNQVNAKLEAIDNNPLDDQALIRAQSENSALIKTTEGNISDLNAKEAQINQIEDQIKTGAADKEQALKTENDTLKQQQDQLEKYQAELKEDQQAQSKLETEKNQETKELDKTTKEQAKTEDEIANLENQEKTHKKLSTKTKAIIIIAVVVAAIIITGIIINFCASTRYYDEYYSNLVQVDVSGLDTSNVENMSHMFEAAITLTGIKFLKANGTTNFTMEKVKTMEKMFYHCENMKSFDFSIFNLKSIENFARMFESCTNLQTITFGDVFKTITKTINMDSMFKNCLSISELDFNMASPMNISALNSCFENCTALMDVKNLKATNKLNTVAKMFSNCSALMGTPLDVSEIDTSNCQYMERVFESCSNLLFLKMNFRIDNAKYVDHMFDGCQKLRRIYTNNDFTPSKKTLKHSNDVFTGCRCLIGGRGYEWEKNFNLNDAKVFTSAKNGLFTSISDMEVYAEPLMHTENYPILDQLEFAQLTQDETEEYYEVEGGSDDEIEPSDDEFIDNDETDIEPTPLLIENRLIISQLSSSNFNSVEFKNCIFVCQHHDFQGFFTYSTFNKLIFNHCTFMGSMSYMFRCCLCSSIEFINCDTRSVVAFEETFRNTTAASIDLSGVNTKYADSMYRIFADAFVLKSIYVSPSFDLTNVPDDEIMFENNEALIGKMAFDPNKLTKKYATTNHYFISK